MTPDYTAFSPADIAAECSAMARDAQAVFGQLDEQQLNWKPDAVRWSVAQCFDHLLMGDRAMIAAADAALDGSVPPTVWQRLPALPRLFGRMLITSQSPGTKRKFKAPASAVPAASAIDARVIDRFIAIQQEAAARAGLLEGRDAARVIMVSPFVRFITYSVLDGYRLLVAHQRRHFEQARRVSKDARFPAVASR